MKRTTAFVFILFFNHMLYAQNVMIDSLKKLLVNATDTVRVNIMNKLSTQYLEQYSWAKSDTTLIAAKHYTEQALTLSRNINFIKGTAYALLNSAVIVDNFSNANKRIALTAYQAALPYLKQSGNEHDIAQCMLGIAESYHIIGKLEQAVLYFDSVTHIIQRSGDTPRSVYTIAMKGHCYFDMGNYRKAYEVGMDALKLAEEINDTTSICATLSHLENLFVGAGLPEIAIDYFHKIVRYYPATLTGKDLNLPWQVYWAMTKCGEAFLKLNEIDSALKIYQSFTLDSANGDDDSFHGHLYTALHQYDKALLVFTKGLQTETQMEHLIGMARHGNDLGRTYLLLGNFNLATKYANEALTTGKEMHALLEMKNAAGTLLDIYTKTKNYEQIYNYSQLYKSLNDSLASDEYKRKLALIQIQNELDNQKQQALLLSRENEIKKQELNKQELIKYFFIAGIIGLLVIAGLVIRSNRQKQKANIALQQQKDKIESTLTELKSTQAQLIQSEKMASLGELTAGIAHEIQNPLNFVNNFSEVNKEMLEELKAERLKPKAHRDELLEDELINNVIDNEEKINHHGKRADAIVKGMLQHSSQKKGVKELTDINALCDEYLRLSYHGLRAKDKSFNAEFKTYFDESLDKINIVPQDIGRALLNLFNNAFYAVNEKKKLSAASYQPAIEIKTRRINDKVEITVSDNGNGIPPGILDKIFQPFFTTKPTGQGTGLGLSLAYDIILKEHNGTIKADSKEGEGSMFIITLPIA